MITIGLTGGIGAGKSYVLKLLKERYGFMTFEADVVASKLMEPGNAIYNQIVDEFGDEILTDEKVLDREALRKIVMNNHELLNKLNSIVHPGVKRYFLDIISSEKYPVIIIESAILLQDGYRDICDEIWYVSADREVRLKRIMDNRGYSYEKAVSFMNNQPDEDYYIQNSDRIISNNDEDLNLKKMLDDTVINIKSIYGLL